MSVFNYEVETYKHEQVSLKTYQGNVLLIVNTATKCGLVGQYEGLQKLYETYKDQGLELLNFPCNQFMNQASQSNEEIQSFCELSYHTTFTTFGKIDVNGKNAHPLYQYIRKQAPLDRDGQGKLKKGLLTKLMGSKIKWNFTKFLVNQQGEVIYRFSPTVQPEKIAPFIETLLKEKV
jgi:glutathione peroxidase